MDVFMVERSLKGLPLEQLAAAQQRAIRTAADMSAAGTPVRYLRTTFVPATGQCLCLFESDSCENVEALNRKADIPFDKVVPALHFAAP
jgi:hypothetical protein